MSRTTACPACGSELYGKVTVYVGDDQTGSLTMQELPSSEDILVGCDNGDCLVNRSGLAGELQVTLTPEEQEKIDEFTHQTAAFMAYANDSTSSLANIASAMSGHEWNADTMDHIAKILRDAGFEIADYEPPEMSAS